MFQMAKSIACSTAAIALIDPCRDAIRRYFAAKVGCPCCGTQHCGDPKRTFKVGVTGSGVVDFMPPADSSPAEQVPAHDVWVSRLLARAFRTASQRRER